MNPKLFDFIKECLFGKYACLYCLGKYGLVWLPCVIGSTSVNQALAVSKPFAYLLLLDIAWFGAAWSFVHVKNWIAGSSCKDNAVFRQLSDLPLLNKKAN